MKSLNRFIGTMFTIAGVCFLAASVSPYNTIVTLFIGGMVALFGGGVFWGASTTSTKGD